MTKTIDTFSQDDLLRMSHVLRHRLRNIAAGISGAVNLIATDAGERLPPDLREYFPLVLKECHSLSEVAKRLGLLWEPESNLRYVTADELTSRLFVMASSQFPNVDLHIQGAATGSVPSLIEVPLRELIINACEAVPYGSVNVEMSQAESHVNWYVSDTGDGIPDTDRDQIFLPFFTTRTRHLGLGLALARKHAEQVGGTCQLCTAESSGCTMQLICPITKPTIESGGEADQWKS